MNTELIAETQDLIDALNRDLIALSQQKLLDFEKVERINSMFRSAHTLKSLGQMFGQPQIRTIASELESLLSLIRLGKMILDAFVMNALFLTVKLLYLLLQQSEGETELLPEIQVEIDNLKKKYATLIDKPDDTNEINEDKTEHKLPQHIEVDAATYLEKLGIPAEYLAVLTEYEEHRLCESIKNKINIFKIETTVDLDNMMKLIPDLNQHLAPLGEIISKIPKSSGVESDHNHIDFCILFASHKSLNEITIAAGSMHAKASKLKLNELNNLQLKTPTTPSNSSTSASIPEKPKKNEDNFEDPGLNEIFDIALAKDESTVSKGLKSTTATVRVDIRHLDKLMNLVGDLAQIRNALHRISDNVRLTLGFTGLALDLHKETRHFEQRLAELQAEIMAARMVPLAVVFERMVGICQHTASDLGRKLRVEVYGEQTELDKLIVEKLADPLMHLLRNAIDHGIEPPAERVAAGKTEEGLVVLAASAVGNHVMIKVSDDGRGIDLTDVVDIATAKGIVTPEKARELDSDKIYNFLFEPGFSTRATVNAYSGRGVGLNIVKTNINQMSGMIDIKSNLRAGTEFSINLPITLAVIAALLIIVEDILYALPLANVIETIVIQQSQIKTIENQEMIAVRDTVLPLLDLRAIFGAIPAVPQQLDSRYAIIVYINMHKLALVVDDIYGEQDIVMKSLGARLQRVPCISGATELEGHHAVLVIDVASLIDIFNATPRELSA